MPGLFSFTRQSDGQRSGKARLKVAASAPISPSPRNRTPIAAISFPPKVEANVTADTPTPTDGTAIKAPRIQMNRATPLG